MKYTYIASAFLLLFSLLFPSCGNAPVERTAAEEQSVADTVSALPQMDSLRCVEGKVKSGQFFSTLMTGLGLNAQEAYDLTIACDTVFNVKNLRVGNEYKAYYDGQILKYVLYRQDRTSDILFECQPPYEVSKVTRPVTVRKRYADVTINSSLWNDMRAAGASPLIILSLSDIYAWTVDFFGLQKGDRFRVLYEEKVCDGEVISIDTVRYAIFTHNGKDLPMVMYDQKDGGNIWWNEKGESMRKAFLKAPLKFSRISSGFSYARRHPVTRRVQPHT
jgi:murein DD-endopeptidase MepM/ murein hydrolase activator NlpD